MVGEGPGLVDTAGDGDVAALESAGDGDVPGVSDGVAAGQTPSEGTARVGLEFRLLGG
jgi:hypothetical protein